MILINWNRILCINSQVGDEQRHRVVRSILWGMNRIKSTIKNIHGTFRNAESADLKQGFLIGVLKNYE